MWGYLRVEQGTAEQIGIAVVRINKGYKVVGGSWWYARVVCHPTTLNRQVVGSIPTASTMHSKALNLFSDIASKASVAVLMAVLNKN
jgi:hypothetical protein